MVKATKKSTNAPIGANKNPINKNPISKKVNNKKTATAVKKSVNANNKEKKLEEGVDGVIEYEDLGKIDSWDWNETEGTDMFMGDDAGGFLCLEEISDVEVDYEGDDVSGKVLKFKRAKKQGRKSGKKAQPTAPLSVEETGTFFDVDTFDEETAAKATKEEKKAGGQTVNGNIIDDKVDDEEVEEVEDESITEVKGAKVVETKTKAQKLLEKKKKELEKLQNQVEKLEAQAEAPKAVQDGNKPLNKRERLAAKRKLEAESKEGQPEQDVDAEEGSSSKKARPSVEDVDSKKVSKKACPTVEDVDSKKVKKTCPAVEDADSKKVKKARPTVEDVDQSVDVSAWKNLNLCESVVNALKYNKFTSPTPIQVNALPLAMEGRDIIGSAETGSGKTLAFGIPIINYLATHPEREGLAGLILTPTRELAIQVRDHIDSMSVFSDMRVVAIVGGMSIQKQERLVKQKPDIIVATPGRLWEIFSNNPDYMDMLKHIKFLVLDEADRMLEKGHFEELTSLLNSISNKRQDTTEWPEELDAGTTKKTLPQDLGKHQTFIYTATLSKDLRFNVKWKKKKLPVKPTNSMEDLLRRIEFADENPALVDMTSENVVAARLLEAKIDCVNTDKDLYIYYFVTRYPGRTIVFVNSIDAIRRLVPIFKLLGVEVLGLHAQMQQKQRLKSLEKFKANPKAVLVASDVAARGLDIPLVDHVIHYQLPRSGEIYVHRSGRTARANRDGVSLLLCGPEEMKIYQKLCQTLRKDKDYPTFPVDLNILRAMTERVKVAVEIDSIHHQESKQTHDVNWMRNMAKEMDVDYDGDTMQGKGYQKSSEDLQKDKVKAHTLKNQLAHLLKQPILPAGVSMKFLTGGHISDLVDRLMKNETHEALPGSSSSKAVEDLHSQKKKKIVF